MQLCNSLVLVARHNLRRGSNAKTVYTTNDHLGSPRINTDGVGAVISRHDYHPFGEEIVEIFDS